MILRLLSKVVTYSLSLFLVFNTLAITTPQANAQTCGRSTHNYCGPTAGCEAGQQCKWGLFTGYECIPDSVACQNVDYTNQTKCGDWNTRDRCGSNVGCQSGYKCVCDGIGCNNPRCEVADQTTDAACLSMQDQVPDIFTPLSCGDITTNASQECSCDVSSPQTRQLIRLENTQQILYCCGYARGATCYNTLAAMNQAGTGNTPPTLPPTPIPTGGGGSGGNGQGDDEDDQTTPPSIFDTGLTSTHFRELNPLERSTVGARLSSPGGIIGRVLQFAFPLAGLILFAMIVWGGFEMLTGAASSKGMDAGKQRVTNAIIGFIILFSSYWIIQIVQTVFGIAIL